jgi:hypothetical protein
MSRSYSVANPATDAWFAFLFDEDVAPIAPSGGDNVVAGVLATVLKDLPAASFRLHRGSMLLHDRAYRATAAEQGVLKAGRLTHSTTYSFDKGLFRVVLHDLSESIRNGSWTTLDLASLPAFLGRSNVHVISIGPVPEAVAVAVDAGLRKPGGYQGALAIDPAEPLQSDLFWSSLFYELCLADGTLTMVLGAIDDPYDLTDLDGWWQGLPVAVVRWRSDGDADPPDLPETRPSSRAKASAKRIAVKSAPSPTERVIQALGRASPSTIPIKVELLPLAPAAIIAPEKLMEYSLNLDHPKGGSKAQAFRDVLGIERDDWRWLADQIWSGVLTAPVAKVRVEQFAADPPVRGVKYHVDLAIVGRNGVVKAVRTAWIVSPGAPPRLTTAYIEGRIDTGTLTPPRPPALADSQLRGDALWAAIFELADRRGNEAANAAVPAPMWVEGTGYSEGEVGGAIITVPDARRGLARWLIKTGRGRRGHRGGAEFGGFRGSQSKARNEAYARACARVLELNGLGCTVRPYLD